MAQLRLYVFGPPRLERAGRLIDFGLRRALALLVYLAVSRQPQSRDTLAALLWPESDQREARANLRRTLHRLGRVIGDVLTTGAETVAISSNADLWVDSEVFTRLVAAGEGLEEAVALYSDDFLAGFTLPDSQLFDEWHFFERERLRLLLAQTLERLAVEAQAHGAWETAADYARRRVALDVLHEPAQRLLMEAYAQAGQTSAALRQYQELARTLERELGTEPEEATRDLYEAIRTRRFPPPIAPAQPAPAPAHPVPPPALLIQLARLIRPDLDPGADEAVAIAQICRLVQGMPLALALERQGKPALAAQLLQTCLDRARERNDRTTWSFAVWNLASIHISFGDFVQARRLFDKAIGTAGEIGHTISLGSAHLERGILELMLGRTSHAESDLVVGATLFASAGVIWEEAWARASLRFVAYQRGDLNTAEALLRRSLADARSIGKCRHIADYLSRLGLVAYARSEPAAALQREALLIWRGMRHEPRIALGACHLVHVLLDQEPGNLYAVRSLLSTVPLQDDQGRHHELEGRASQPSSEGILREAHELAREALKFALRHQLAPSALDVCVAVAHLLLAEGRAEQALSLLDYAETHAASSRLCKQRARQLRHLAGGVCGLHPVPDAPEQPNDWRSVAQQLLHRIGDETNRLQPPTPTNLSMQLPPLLGRNNELARLVDLLHTPSRRLITLLGPGGIGKTRLAQEAALIALERFEHGAFFVPLAHIAEPAHLVTAIAETLGLRFSDTGVPYKQLPGFLHEKQLLLLLDNFEHLSESAGLLGELLQAAPRLVILVTSRERLGLSGELVFPLGGIAVPTGEDDEQAMEYGAVQLLLHHLRNYHPGLNPAPHELDAIIRICRLVEGMPLAIILAASWVELLSLDEIADEIAHNLDILEADLRDLPERQHSVRAVFEVSWQRLRPATQHVFAHMAVFRGNFSRRAAEHIAGADLRALRALVNASFVAVVKTDRYTIHELLRQFGTERLAESGETEALLDRHSLYYLRAVAEREADLKGLRQAEALREIEGDLENVRQAWGRAIQRGNSAAIDGALEALYHFFEMRGRRQEGEAFFGLAAGSDGALVEGRTRSRAVARLYALRVFTVDQDAHVEPALAGCLADAEAAGDAFEVAFCHMALGYHASRQKRDYAGALEHHERSLYGFCAIEDRFYVGQLLFRVGYCHFNVTGAANRYRLTAQSVMITRAVGDLVGNSRALTNLAEAALGLGRYAEAEQCSHEAIAVSLRMGMANAQAHLQLGVALLLQGDPAAARSCASEGYTLAARQGNPILMGEGQALLSLHAGITGNALLGARLAGEALALPTNPTSRLLGCWGTAIAAADLNRHEQAWRALREAFAGAQRMASPAMFTWLLPVAALLTAHDGALERAAELLSLSRSHPLSPQGWMEHWQPLVRLEARLNTPAFAAARRRGAGLAIDAVVAILVREPL